MSHRWGVTPREAEVMDLMLILGHQKLVADGLGISDRTAECHIKHVKKKMGSRHRIVAAVMWDRYRRGDVPATV